MVTSIVESAESDGRVFGHDELRGTIEGRALPRQRDISGIGRDGRAKLARILMDLSTEHPPRWAARRIWSNF
jgi:hypothetical protein